MKTLITVAIFTCSFLTLQASTAAGDSSLTRVIPSSEIVSNVPYPGIAIEQGISGVVKVRLELLEDGSLNVLQVYSKDEFLQEHVINHINQMFFDPRKFQTNEPFNIQFKFKLSE